MIREALLKDDFPRCVWVIGKKGVGNA